MTVVTLDEKQCGYTVNSPDMPAYASFVRKGDKVTIHVRAEKREIEVIRGGHINKAWTYGEQSSIEMPLEEFNRMVQGVL